MQKSGFFNAVLQNGVYDRKYNADDYCDNLAVVISNGVLRSTNDDLKVTANGMSVTVGVGRAWINGHYYNNDTEYSFPTVTAPTGGSRIDRVVLRLNKALSIRSITLGYVKGVEAVSPTPPAPVRNGDIYELVIADILVKANAPTVSVTDKRGDSTVCGWVFSTSGDESFYKTLDNQFNDWFEKVRNEVASVTLFKRYTWTLTFNTESNTVMFNIPQYDKNTCFIETYVNGILEVEGKDYTLSDTLITFDGVLTAGTKIIVNCYKSIDGTGIMSVAAEITELQNKVNAIQGDAKYTYVCKGHDDNIILSQIADAIAGGVYEPDYYDNYAIEFLTALGGQKWVDEIGKTGQVGISVVGNFKATAAANGTGAAERPYRWLDLDSDSAAARGRKVKINFDFSKCNKIEITCAANTINYLVYGNNLSIKNLNIKATSTAANCVIDGVRTYDNTGRVYMEDCTFEISTSGAVKLAQHGTWANCYGNITSEGAAAYCFKPIATGLIRVIGGEYIAYGKTTTGISSAIFHTSASDTDAVAMASNIHCPTIEKAGYTQGFLSVANAGKTYINGVVTRLTSQGSYNEIIGHINRSKS